MLLSLILSDCLAFVTQTHTPQLTEGWLWGVHLIVLEKVRVRVILSREQTVLCQKQLSYVKGRLHRISIDLPGR